MRITTRGEKNRKVGGMLAIVLKRQHGPHSELLANTYIALSSCRVCVLRCFVIVLYVQRVFSCFPFVVCIFWWVLIVLCLREALNQSCTSCFRFVSL